MPENEKTPPPSPTQPADEAAKQSASPAFERIWKSELGAGEPVDFDPALHQPALSDEEVAEILAKEKE